MVRMWSVLTLAAAAGALAAAPQPQKGEPAEPKIEGVWTLTFGVREGVPVDPGADTHWTLDALGKGRGHRGTDAAKDESAYKFALTFDFKKKTVDYKGSNDKVVPGIYEVRDKGDTIVFCFNFKQNERPKFIDSNSAYGFTEYEFKREKENGGKQ